MNITNTKLARASLLAIAVFSIATPFWCARAADAQPPADPARAQAQGGRALALDDLFATLDKNHDVKISKEEATGTYAQRFSQWDADGDGFATRQEIHDFRLRLGVDDNGLRIANRGPGGTNAVQAAAGNPGNNPRNQGGQRPAAAAATAAILKEPADWRLETMSIPPGFAPGIKLTGSEEIRFAPGMFDTSSSNYFTCVLAILAEGAPELGAVDIKDFLEKYYSGLSTGVGQRKGLTPDPEQMKAVVHPAPAGPDAKNRFVAQVVFFDSFSDGRKITLNVEAQVIPRPATKKTCLILLVSPSPKTAAAWPSLRDIGKKAAMNAP